MQRADVSVAVGDWAQAEGSAKVAMCPVLCGLWPGKGSTASAGGSGASPPDSKYVQGLGHKQGRRKLTAAPCPCDAKENQEEA